MKKLLTLLLTTTLLTGCMTGKNNSISHYKNSSGLNTSVILIDQDTSIIGYNEYEFMLISGGTIYLYGREKLKVGKTYRITFFKDFVTKAEELTVNISQSKPVKSTKTKKDLNL